MRSALRNIGETLAPPAPTNRCNQSSHVFCGWTGYDGFQSCRLRDVPKVLPQEGKNINVRVDDDLAEQVVERAKEEERTISQLVRRALKLYLRTPTT